MLILETPKPYARIHIQEPYPKKMHTYSPSGYHVIPPCQQQDAQHPSQVSYTTPFFPYINSSVVMLAYLSAYSPNSKLLPQEHQISPPRHLMAHSQRSNNDY